MKRSPRMIKNRTRSHTLCAMFLNKPPTRLTIQQVYELVHTDTLELTHCCEMNDMSWLDFLE